MHILSAMSTGLQKKTAYIGVFRPGRHEKTMPLPAGHFVRLVMHPVRQPHARQRVQRHLPPFLGTHAGIHQRQLHIPQRIRPRQQIEGLENEADFPVPDLRQLVVIHLADVRAVQFIQARRGRVQAAQQVHQRGLARTRRPHDRHVFAPLDLQRNIPQCVDGFLPI